MTNEEPPKDDDKKEEKGNVIHFKNNSGEIGEVPPQYDALGSVYISMAERRMAALEKKGEAFRHERFVVEELLQETRETVRQLEDVIARNAGNGDEVQTLENMKARENEINALLERIHQRDDCLDQLMRKEGELQELYTYINNDTYKERYRYVMDEIERLRAMQEKYADVSDAVSNMVEKCTQRQDDEEQRYKDSWRARHEDMFRKHRDIMEEQISAIDASIKSVDDSENTIMEFCGKMREQGTDCSAIEERWYPRLRTVREQMITYKKMLYAVIDAENALYQAEQSGDQTHIAHSKQNLKKVRHTVDEKRHIIARWESLREELQQVFTLNGV